MLSRIVKRIIFPVALCVLAFGPAVAQDGPPPPEKGTQERGPQERGRGGMQANPKGWEAQARMVGEAIGLKTEEITKLVDVYKASRESTIAAFTKMMAGDVDREKMREIMRETMTAERAKLEAAIKGIMSAENAAKAIVPLAANARSRWDSMALLIEEMKLEPKTKLAASSLILDYVVACEKLVQPAADKAAPDRERFTKMREEMTKLKEKLDADMAKVLSADQAKKWTEETARRGGPGGGGPGGGPGGAPAGAPAGPGGDR